MNGCNGIQLRNRKLNKLHKCKMRSSTCIDEQIVYPFGLENHSFSKIEDTGEETSKVSI